LKPGEEQIMRKSRRLSLPAKTLLLGFVAAACALGISATIASAMHGSATATSLRAAGPHFTGWSTPVNLGPTINTTSAEAGPALSKNGLSLYFYSDRPGGFGVSDIWVSQRESVDDAWGAPVNLGPTINSAFADIVPAFSRDGHWVFFASFRPGGFGGADHWASWRPHTHDDFGWQAPTNLGANVNTAAFDAGSGYFENDEAGAPQLFFGSTRTSGLGGTDMYMSTLQADGSWGPATLIPELNSTADDNRANVRHDGLEIFFYSARAGGAGGVDLWVATRDTVDAAWSTPVNLGAPVNTSATELHPYLAADAETLFFSSSRAGGSGGLDLYVTTRSKSKG
jgi:Tol biopolymer transport system component